MVKVKIFGVIRTTTGFGYIETDAKTVNDIFEIISKKMAQGYKEEQERIEKMKRDYLDSLKPDKPLRFCPSDEELLRRFKFDEKNKTISKPKEVAEIVDESTEEDEIEM